jgi:hypothetical protein
LRFTCLCNAVALSGAAKAKPRVLSLIVDVTRRRIVKIFVLVELWRPVIGLFLPWRWYLANIVVEYLGDVPSAVDVASRL